MEQKNTSKKEIMKPASLLIKEVRDSITDCINKSNLHPLVLAMILKEIYISSQENANIFAQNEILSYENQPMPEEPQDDPAKPNK